MQLVWKSSNKYNPETILQRIEKSRSIDENGRVSFSGFEIEQNLSVLKSMVLFPDEIPEIERTRSIWQIISSEKEEFIASKILRKINKYFNDLEKAERKKYYLLSSISLSKKNLPNELNILGVNLKFFVGSYPDKFNTRFDFIKELGMFKNPNPVTYTKIIVRVQEKTPFIAAYMAFRAVDYFRAIACLFANPMMEYLSNEWYPINKVRLGEFHSLHDSNGEIPIQTYWFEPNFVEERIFISTENENFKNNVYKWIRTINRTPYKEIIIESLQRYVRALDEKDPYTALIKIWNSLEYLSCGEYAKYNTIVARVSNIFNEREYHVQVLEHLRDVRNTSVHSGSQIDSARKDCYLIQYYYYYFIRFLIGNYKSFKVIEDAYEFLDLPNDVIVLKERKKKLEKAIKYRK